MRMRRKKSRRRPNVTLNLASMIDVTFLLLLYFLVTTVLARPEDRLSPTLQTRSESAAGPISDFQPQIVDVLRIDGQLAFRMGAQIFRDKASLTAVLKPLPKSAGLFVHVFDDASVGMVAAAFQAGRDVGFEQVTYVPADE